MTFFPLAYIGMPGPFEMAIIAGIVLLLFGNRLPGAMRSMGRSINEFKTGMKEGEETDAFLKDEDKKSDSE